MQDLWSGQTQKWKTINMSVVKPKIETKGTYIQFVFVGYSKTGKTKIWNVASIEDQFFIGDIRFDAGWWCYILSPYEGTKFKKTWLREIADFCEEQTEKWRLEKTPKRPLWPF
jgi:hypothetical protein